MFIVTVEGIIALGVLLLLAWLLRRGGQDRPEAAKPTQVSVEQLLDIVTPPSEESKPLVADPTQAPVTTRILVVEDEPGVLAYVSSTLRGLGYDVVTAGNGPAALDLLEHDDMIELLFTDVILPHGMSGFEVAKRARAARPTLKVLLTSAYSEAAAAHYEGEELQLPLLRKPYRRKELAEMLASLIGTGKSDRARRNAPQLRLGSAASVAREPGAS